MCDRMGSSANVYGDTELRVRVCVCVCVCVYESCVHAWWRVAVACVNAVYVEPRIMYAPFLTLTLIIQSLLRRLIPPIPSFPHCFIVGLVLKDDASPQDQLARLMALAS